MGFNFWTEQYLTCDSCDKELIVNGRVFSGTLGEVQHQAVLSKWIISNPRYIICDTCFKCDLERITCHTCDLSFNVCLICEDIKYARD